MNRGTVPAAKSARTAVSDSLYCTVDTSRVEEANRCQTQIGNIRKAIESDMRKSQRQETWKCAAVVTDARNPDRIKILCRDQTELKQVKEAAQKTVTSGARRTAVLDAEGNVLPGAAEALGAENYVTIAKITWLSNREKAKAYGSMVIYPPPYAKRWWTKDLTRLRRTYTYWRNQARAQRRAEKAHWDDFVTDESNIWKAVKYVKSGTEMTDDKVPPLKRADGSITEGKGEQAEELLSTFFPPLPTRIEPEGERSQREEIAMPDLTLQEIEDKVMAAKPWKAPGEDGPVWTLFDSSLREGVVPHQWRTAKIIPLRKPVVAERISYAVEAHGLLPANHFGARKRRSADQALVLLQERIYKAWRMGRVLSLISFDVKGAYNGVCKERLLDRMRARGIPDRLVVWMDAFCSERTASVVVNGHTSEQQTLPQAGLPQGSPLSPVAFLFFNADLVQRRIKSNRDEKTSVIHFTRIAERDSDLPLIIKGNDVKPKSNVKLLGVIMDKALRFKEHIARAAAKGLAAAMCLKRLKMASPRMARQLFVATVAPAMDY
ncbi:reverse transcriptase (RNA-dependent DNA polymerase) domain-containing protein [Hirsutella rhossiliensis]|uniref:Reverse transcriptase (RNA-dependent DNA polymerase) domain-containing protein n=1 Tax=Hirsutella rhossiliensis TaxID=111463 RepID=A0A9P8SDB6_9HYPO|nr:reverse transcriptase (RNA-dependent DNA polymerase) domain-containing protein [Hirsutella rhossiliensis]KAH0957784.1 reverse transcriptase (RNA-dependent DNA polymerase) domain-containing protein [Hirsutella rhossiliensis]